MAINPNHRTLKRRFAELAAAGSRCPDPDVQGLLLFYAAECALKALYMTRFSLRSTDVENAGAKAARSYAHNLDQILVALRVSTTDCPTRPAIIRLRNGQAIDVGLLHEAWRYGEKVDNHEDVVAWIKQIISYVETRV